MSRQRGEPFFFVMGIVLMAIVVAGFGPAAFARPGGIAAIPVLLHVHGAVFVSWFLLFCVQARLVTVGNVQLHRRLGTAGVLIAAAMIALSYFVIRGAYARTDFSIAGLSPAGSVMFPFTDMVNFTIAFVLAILNRRTAYVHKRLMLLAGVLIIDPAVARLVLTLSAPPPVMVLLELALLGAIITYDLITRRRPSWPGLLGLALFAAALALKIGVAPTLGWSKFVQAVFG